MSGLTGSQRQLLRGMAHGLEPAVQIGREGLTDTVVTAIGRSLDAHELVKVRIAAERDDRKRMSRAIESELGCECVGLIGRMAILYRRHPDPEKRKILLPD